MAPQEPAYDLREEVIQTFFAERRKERKYRYIRFIGGIAMFTVVMMLSVGKNLFSDGENINGFGTKIYHTYKETAKDGADATIAIIELDGVIGESLSSNGAISETAVNTILEKIKKDNTVQYVVLKIQSPGGGALETDKIFRAIKKMFREKKIPIVSYIDGIAASGGYYLALAGEEIYAYPSSLVGNVGVIMQLPNYQHLADKLGFRVQTFKSGKFKDMGNPLRKMTREETDIFQSYIDEMYQRFSDIVRTSRGERLKNINAGVATDGRIFTASQAKTIGLVDEIATFDEIIQSLADELQIINGFGEVTAIRYYPARPSRFAMLFGAFRHINSFFDRENTFTEPRAYYRCC